MTYDINAQVLFASSTFNTLQRLEQSAANSCFRYNQTATPVLTEAILFMHTLISKKSEY
jgi:hypothetical protein